MTKNQQNRSPVQGLLKEVFLAQFFGIYTHMTSYTQCQRQMHTHSTASLILLFRVSDGSNYITKTTVTQSHHLLEHTVVNRSTLTE